MAKKNTLDPTKFDNVVGLVEEKIVEDFDQTGNITQRIMERRRFEIKKLE